MKPLEDAIRTPFASSKGEEEEDHHEDNHQEEEDRPSSPHRFDDEDPQPLVSQEPGQTTASSEIASSTTTTPRPLHGPTWPPPPQPPIPIPTTTTTSRPLLTPDPQQTDTTSTTTTTNTPRAEQEEEKQEIIMEPPARSRHFRTTLSSSSQRPGGSAEEGIRHPIRATSSTMSSGSWDGRTATTSRSGESTTGDPTGRPHEKDTLEVVTWSDLPTSLRGASRPDPDTNETPYSSTRPPTTPGSKDPPSAIDNDDEEEEEYEEQLDEDDNEENNEMIVKKDGPIYTKELSDHAAPYLAVVPRHDDHPHKTGDPQVAAADLLSAPPLTLLNEEEIHHHDDDDDDNDNDDDDNDEQDLNDELCETKVPAADLANSSTTLSARGLEPPTGLSRAPPITRRRLLATPGAVSVVGMGAAAAAEIPPRSRPLDAPAGGRTFPLVARPADQEEHDPNNLSEWARAGVAIGAVVQARPVEEEKDEQLEELFLINQALERQLETIESGGTLPPSLLIGGGPTSLHLLSSTLDLARLGASPAQLRDHPPGGNPDTSLYSERAPPNDPGGWGEVTPASPAAAMIVAGEVAEVPPHGWRKILDHSPWWAGLAMVAILCSGTTAVGLVVGLQGGRNQALGLGSTAAPTTSFRPSVVPTGFPTAGPTASVLPTSSAAPSRTPSPRPPLFPSAKPSHHPTAWPSGPPSLAPTVVPSPKPMKSPSLAPTLVVGDPSKGPSPPVLPSNPAPSDNAATAPDTFSPTFFQNPPLPPPPVPTAPRPSSSPPISQPISPPPPPPAPLVPPSPPITPPPTLPPTLPPPVPPPSSSPVVPGTLNPTRSPLSAPSPGKACFLTSTELQVAVAAYLNNVGPSTWVAKRYGYPLGTWCVSKIKSMSRLFSARRLALAGVFNEDISAWNVSAVTDMSAMLEGAESFDQDLGGWSVSRVVWMDAMFAGAASFQGKNLKSWDVSRVVNMKGMFQQASSFDQDLNSWDVGQVADMDYMFTNATQFNGKVGSWDVGRVVSMTSMFQGATSFQQDLSRWDVSRVRRFSNFLQGAVQFRQDLCGWGPRLASTVGWTVLWRATTTTNMFDDTSCPNTSSPDLSIEPSGPWCFAC